MTQMYCHLFMIHSVPAIHKIPIIVTHVHKMLYFHNSFQYIQKSAIYAAKSFQLLGGFAPRPLTTGSALDPTGDRAPRPHHLHPQYLLFPKLRGFG